MIEFMLNLRKRDNYAFFDPESRLHLTAAMPRGYAPSVTARIQRGLDTQVLIKLEESKNETPKKAPAEPTKSAPEPVVASVPEEPKAEAPIMNEPVIEEPKTKESVQEETPEINEEKKPATKRGRKSSK